MKLCFDCGGKLQKTSANVLKCSECGKRISPDNWNRLFIDSDTTRCKRFSLRMLNLPSRPGRAEPSILLRLKGYWKGPNNE